MNEEKNTHTQTIFFFNFVDDIFNDSNSDVEKRKIQTASKRERRREECFKLARKWVLKKIILIPFSVAICVRARHCVHCWLDAVFLLLLLRLLANRDSSFYVIQQICRLSKQKSQTWIICNLSTEKACIKWNISNRKQKISICKMRHVHSS